MAINVLIVDSSLRFCSFVREVLQDEKSIKIIGLLYSGDKVFPFLESEKPIDIIILSINLIQTNPTLIIDNIARVIELKPDLRKIGILLTGHSRDKELEETLKGFKLGFLGFIQKPEELASKERSRSFCNKLFANIWSWRATRDQTAKEKVELKAVQRGAKKVCSNNIEAIVIGVSTGGPKALAILIPELCRKFTRPIIIVQHMPRQFTASLAESLDKISSAKIMEAKHGDPIRDHYVYIAPGGYHLLLKESPNHQVLITLNEELPEDGYRPSVNILFRSAIRIFGRRVLAVVLTGMGSDGTKGLAEFKKQGAPIVVQDKQSSVVWGMPGSAVEAGVYDKICVLDKIPAWVEQFILKGV